MTYDLDDPDGLVNALAAEVGRLRVALKVYADAWPEDWSVDLPDDIWRDPGRIARAALSIDRVTNCYITPSETGG